MNQLVAEELGCPGVFLGMEEGDRRRAECGVSTSAEVSGGAKRERGGSRSQRRTAIGLKVVPRSGVKFVPAIAHHFCLNLPAAFTQPGTTF